MRKPCSGVVRTYATNGGKYKYYMVSTTLNGKHKGMYFPYTKSGLRRAKKALKEYWEVKNQEVEARQKDAVKGVKSTKRLKAGGLKHIWVTLDVPRGLAMVVVNFTKDRKRVSGNARCIHIDGFDKTVDAQLDKLCRFYKLDRRTSDIKSRIETTRRLLKKRYKELCKEHGFRPSW